MGSVNQRVIQHDFGFPRFVNAADAEVSALYSLCIVVSAAKRAALKLTRDFPEHDTMCRAIADFATDGTLPIAGPISRACMRPTVRRSTDPRLSEPPRISSADLPLILLHSMVF